MKRYFITGGTGFVGRSIVRELLKHKDTEQITCLTRGYRQDLIMDRRVDYVKGDITDVRFPNKDYTDIIHGANEANDLLQPDRHAYYYAIVEGTKHLLEWAEDTSVQRIIYLSSGAVRKGDSAYCRAKRLAESICNHSTLPVKIARVFSLVGEEMPLNGQYAIGKFVHQALKDGEVKLWGGTSIRSYMHVDDCARWIVRILDIGDERVIYDVGAERPIWIRDLAYLVGRRYNVPVKMIPTPEGEPHRSAEIYIPNTNNAKALGLKETISLEESLDRVKDYIGAIH